MKKIFFLIFLLFITINVYKLNSNSIIIPDSSIRLRVIPNSNSPLDINIKEKVKTYLEDNIYSLTKDIKDIDIARNIINSNTSVIKENISNIFITNDYHLPYEVNYGSNYFPQKTYKGITYKEGYYESIVIKIGDGNGDNWWCVLFPNFCLIDTKEKPQYKLYFKELFSSKK